MEQHPDIDLAATLERVEARIARERGPLAWLRSRPRPGRFALLLVVVLLEVGYFYLTGRRRDWDVYPVARMAVALAAMGSLVAVALWDLLRPIYLAPRRRWFGLALLGAGLLGPALLALLPELPTLSTRYRGWPSDWICLLGGLVHGLIVAAAIALVARDGRQLLYGALAAAVTGLLVAQVECPYNDRIHLLLGHASIVPAALLVLIVGRRLLRDL